jgi:hypothetical protein
MGNKAGLSGILLLACLVVLALPAAPTEADSRSGLGCGSLQVVMGPGSWTFHKVTCGRGSVVRQTSNMLLLSQAVEPIQDGLACRVVCQGVSRNGEKQIGTFVVTQNACVMKAGNIHVVAEGHLRPVYESHEGSFADQRPGLVKIMGFQF